MTGYKNALFKYFITTLALIFYGSCSEKDGLVGHTEIAKWQHGKKAAISLTFDDGTINQFRKALPFMDSLGFPGTFYIVTGEIPGSEYLHKFTGRSVNEIIKETAQKPTDQDNFFERASAIGLLDFEESLAYHVTAGQWYEEGKVKEAYRHIDEAYLKARKNKSTLKSPALTEATLGSGQITWDEIRTFAANGHEFGSHTISHPRLAVLDEENMIYELEKSKEEILKQLGPEHTFSAECPFGTENERVMEYAHRIYPALRNRMPEDYLDELNRWNKSAPGKSRKEYVQWQRGPLSATSMDLMKSWVDTLLQHDNIWLVLVFHGVDGIGWEAKSMNEFKEYFNYIKQHEEGLWVATFKEVTKYMRQRMNAQLKVEDKGNRIVIALDHSLDKTLYNVPLTLKTYVPSGWKQVTVSQAGKLFHVPVYADERGKYVLFEAIPGLSPLELSKR